MFQIRVINSQIKVIFNQICWLLVIVYLIYSIYIYVDYVLKDIFKENILFFNYLVDDLVLTGDI